VLDFLRHHREHLFASVIGLADGILTALTLAAGKVIGSHQAIEGMLALRIATAGSASGAFIFFVAQYSHLRGELVHAERHLNLTPQGRLAVTHLGRTVLQDALCGSIISGIFSFIGALFPLLLATICPLAPWVAILAALGALSLLGMGLGHVVYGNPSRWALGLLTVGIVLAGVGLGLHIL
jgi:VIT1/CCC1 family predicted Fe2+/Mn2+ transporter